MASGPEFGTHAYFAAGNHLSVGRLPIPTVKRMAGAVPTLSPKVSKNGSGARFQNDDPP